MLQRLGTLAAALCLAAVAGDAAGAYPPRPGQAHPDFTLPSVTDGKFVSLAQFRGRKVLLIHFGSW